MSFRGRDYRENYRKSERPSLKERDQPSKRKYVEVGGFLPKRHPLEYISERERPVDREREYSERVRERPDKKNFSQKSSDTQRELDYEKSLRFGSHIGKGLQEEQPVRRPISPQQWFEGDGFLSSEEHHRHLEHRSRSPLTEHRRFEREFHDYHERPLERRSRSPLRQSRSFEIDCPEDYERSYERFRSPVERPYSIERGDDCIEHETPYMSEIRGGFIEHDGSHSIERRDESIDDQRSISHFFNTSRLRNEGSNKSIDNQGRSLDRSLSPPRSYRSGMAPEGSEHERSLTGSSKQTFDDKPFNDYNEKHFLERYEHPGSKAPCNRDTELLHTPEKSNQNLQYATEMSTSGVTTREISTRCQFYTGNQINSQDPLCRQSQISPFSARPKRTNHNLYNQQNKSLDQNISESNPKNATPLQHEAKQAIVLSDGEGQNKVDDKERKNKVDNEEGQNRVDDKYVTVTNGIISPRTEIVEMYENCAPSYDEVGRLLKGFAIYFGFKDSSELEEDPLTVLLESFHLSDGFEKLDCEYRQYQSSNQEKKWVCTLRWKGVMLARGDGESKEKAHKVAAIILINTLAKTCYTIQTNGEYVNRRLPAFVMRTRESPGYYKIVQKNEVIRGVTKTVKELKAEGLTNKQVDELHGNASVSFLDKFFEDNQETHCELFFGPVWDKEFTIGELKIIASHAETKELQCRWLHGVKKKAPGRYLAVSNCFSPQNLVRYLKSKNCKTVRYTLLPPQGPSINLLTEDGKFSDNILKYPSPRGQQPQWTTPQRRNPNLTYRGSTPRNQGLNHPFHGPNHHFEGRNPFMQGGFRRPGPF